MCVQYREKVPEIFNSNLVLIPESNFLSASSDIGMYSVELIFSRPHTDHVLEH